MVRSSILRMRALRGALFLSRLRQGRIGTAERHCRFDRRLRPITFDDGNALYPKFPAREDCASADHCTLLEEQANFLNYYTWYRTRGRAMKASLGKVISEADDNLRIGFTGSNGRNSQVALDNVSADGQRAALLNEIYGFSYKGQSAFFNAFEGVGEYLACRSPNQFSVSFGATQGAAGSSGCPVLAAPQGTCQQNYILLVTDGGMEGDLANLDTPDDADGDGSPSGVFDGAVFASESPYNDATLADIAMHYYERDLFSITDDVVPLTRDLALAPSGTFASGSMHQHVKTFAVAFGVDSGLVDPPTTYSSGSYNWGYYLADGRSIEGSFS